jgi:hypothetical protein
MENIYNTRFKRKNDFWLAVVTAIVTVARIHAGPGL